MLPEHGPFHVSNFGLGANTSDDKELTGVKEASGEFIEGRNARSTSTEGYSGSSNKIKGEAIKYPRNVSGSYSCIGAIAINGNIVEIYASPVSHEDSFVRVNGVVVLKSSLFPVTYNHPLQLDRNEDEKGGEIFVTDYNVEPFILNIQDMVDSLVATPLKYFTGFDFKLYSVNLYVPMDMPAFVEVVNVGGGGGLPIGAYSYQLRYSNTSGDKTNLSQRTPEIPIVENLSIQSLQYPGVKTYGQDPSPDFGTRYGIKLRFRVTNLQGYDFIEVIRTSYNTNGGIDFVPAPKVIAKVDIFAGEISVREFTDPSESNTDLVLSDEDITREITYINRAKSIRYFDRRLVLMNVELESKSADLTFGELNTKKMFPAIENIGTIGFNDPYNFVYKRHSMHGERFGYGVELWDGVGGKGFVTKVPGFLNYQIPNRRDPVSAETLLYSYGGVVRAADVNNSINDTHEVFDLTSATSKLDKCSFKNIYHNRIASFILGTKDNFTVKQDCDETNGEIESHGAKVYTVVKVSPYYHPFTPKAQNDSDVSGHNYVINTQVGKAYSLVVGSSQPNVDIREPYSPKIFGPTYYSQGMALTGVDNFPKWAKAFSVVRTEPAKRVIAQGLAVYKLNPADYDLLTNKKLATKDTDQFWFYSPDIENGIVSGKLVDDIIASPESYELQFVAPLGFASEVYSFDAHNTNPLRDRCVDIIAYARMIRDKYLGDDTWEINPMEDIGMGIADGGFNYVGYDKFRNISANSGAFANNDKGNNLFGITEAQRITEGRGTYIRMRVDRNFYAQDATGGNGDSNFENDGMKNFTEPFYMVNIVESGAKVRDQNIENYKITSHYQKIESIIGKGTGLANQKYQLVDERWEDVISALSSTHPTASTDRYIYIKDPNTGNVEQWVNVTYKTSGQIATIMANIASSIGTVKGMYRHEFIDNNKRFFNIVFNVMAFIPAIGNLILIRYDSSAPIRFWGGDSVIGESIFAPIDRESSANGLGSVSDILKSAPETQFPFGIGFPYKLWKINPRCYQIRRTRAGALANVIQDRNWGYLGYIRQMCVMFTAETRIALTYAHNNPNPQQFFPLMHYVIRPHRWDTDRNIYDNNIYDQYSIDYPGEMDMWKWGGFRFLQNINADYSTKAPKEFVSKPEFGFVEQTLFKTRTMWSLPRQINQQNTPGLKTFPANNSFDIDDNQGEIKKAYSSTTDKGENIYAITNKGICLLVTKKSILSDVDGGQLAYMAANTFVKQQYWINKEVGMFDEFWRTAVEGYVPVTLEDGSEVRVEALFFANNESVFRFMDNQVKDIGRIKYHNTLYPEVLSKVLPGYNTKITGGFDKYNQEYWLTSNIAEVKKTHVFSQKNDRWFGYYDYSFDRFTSIGNKMYGFRNVETYDLGVGYVINGADIVYELTGVSAPKQFADKEFIRIRVNTGEEVKPTSFEFFDKFQGPVIYRVDSSLGPMYMKKYRGWESYIGRKLASVSQQRNRVQGRLLIWKVIHDKPEDFRVIDVGVMYKNLK